MVKATRLEGCPGAAGAGPSLYTVPIDLGRGPALFPALHSRGGLSIKLTSRLAGMLPPPLPPSPAGSAGAELTVPPWSSRPWTCRGREPKGHVLRGTAAIAAAASPRVGVWFLAGLCPVVFRVQGRFPARTTPKHRECWVHSSSADLVPLSWQLAVTLAAAAPVSTP